MAAFSSTNAKPACFWRNGRPKPKRAANSELVARNGCECRERRHESSIGDARPVKESAQLK